LSGSSRRARRGFVAALALGSAGLVAGCSGLFAGPRPERLGVVDGRLQPVRTELSNAVSSFATTDAHRIAPIDASPDPRAAFAKLRAVMAGWPGATIVEERPGYLYAECRTRWMGFVDDVEFLLDAGAGVIHVRSASRLGRRDLGTNRERVEAIRAAYANASR
jgi:uncharacterized protein (DUF1499 family)